MSDEEGPVNPAEDKSVSIDLNYADKVGYSEGANAVVEAMHQLKGQDDIGANAVAEAMNQI